MSSEAQLRANRINAERSTGPRTAAGKQLSRNNALKHGLTAKAVVLPCESDLEFQQLRGALLTEFDPQSASEMFLVDQLAQSWWRLNRSRRYETGMLAQLGPDSDAGLSPADLDHHRRYESAIERAYYRAYDRLGRVVRRRTKPVESTEPNPIGFVSQNPVAHGRAVQPGLAAPESRNASFPNFKPAMAAYKTPETPPTPPTGNPARAKVEV